MFSPQIVGSDDFLDMSSSAQALYFHLGMYADDDGFASPKKIMRMANAAEDDLKILIAKKFVLPFENGVIVIKHWRMNNQVRLDRYHETQYSREKSVLYIRENGAYTFNPENAKPLMVASIETKSQPSGNQMATNCKPSIGKVRLGKDSIVKVNTVNILPTVEQVSVEPSAPTPSDEAKDFFQNDGKQKSMIDFLVSRGCQPEFARAELFKFISYWTEKTLSGKKERWQTQKTFEIKRRLITWFDKSSKMPTKQQETKGITI